MMANQNIKSWSAGTESARKKTFKPSFLFEKVFRTLIYKDCRENPPFKRSMPDLQWYSLFLNPGRNEEDIVFLSWEDKHSLIFIVSAV